ncbi:hypothetical protein BC834DRAFT_418519 [Gloeopeniophorella convolvens]|nr:hypothetical protein BC834DRAFT_418519 [Gloeopeniophorella convolvens]
MHTHHPPPPINARQVDSPHHQYLPRHLSDEILYQEHVPPMFSVYAFESVIDSASEFIGRAASELFGGVTKTSIVAFPIVAFIVLITPSFRSSLLSIVISAPQDEVVNEQYTRSSHSCNDVQRQSAPIQNNFFMVNAGSDPTAVADGIRQALRPSTFCGRVDEVSQFESITEAQ